MREDGGKGSEGGCMVGFVYVVVVRGLFRGRCGGLG